MHILSDATDLQLAHFQRMMMTCVSHEYKTPLNAIITSTQINPARLAALKDQVAAGLKD